MLQVDWRFFLLIHLPEQVSEILFILPKMLDHPSFENWITGKSLDFQILREEFSAQKNFKNFWNHKILYELENRVFYAISPPEPEIGFS